MILAGVQVDERAMLAAAMRKMRPTRVPTMRWALVRDHFAIASTQAYALCREFSLDPEEKLKP